MSYIFVATTILLDMPRNNVLINKHFALAHILIY